MTDNTQELDEILDEFLTDIYMNNEHFAANQEALDKTKEEPMQAITDWHNKQVEELLDRLRSDAVYGEYSTADDDSEQGEVVPVMTIEAERNRLKGGNERLRSLGITKEQIDAVEYFGDPPKKLKENYTDSTR